jgi:hypothetical protein
MAYYPHRYNQSGNPFWYAGGEYPYPGYPYATAEPPVPLTVADLDAYFATGLNAAAWAALTPEQKAAALAEAQRWLATLCWTGEGCCGRDYEAALLMATAELALALATAPGAIIGAPSDGRWIQREKLDVLEVEYDMLQPNQGIGAPNSNYPLIIQRFPWLKDILGCWLQLGPKREIRLYRN